MKRYQSFKTNLVAIVRNDGREEGQRYWVRWSCNEPRVGSACAVSRWQWMWKKVRWDRFFEAKLTIFSDWLEMMNKRKKEKMTPVFWDRLLPLAPDSCVCFLNISPWRSKSHCQHSVSNTEALISLSPKLSYCLAPSISASDSSILSTAQDKTLKQFLTSPFLPQSHE